MRHEQQQNEPPVVILYGCIVFVFVFVFVFALLCAAIITGAL